MAIFVCGGWRVERGVEVEWWGELGLVAKVMGLI